MPNELSNDNFDAEVLESDQPVVVDFWAPWCGPCRAISPILEDLSAARDDLRVVKVNIDDNQQLAARYQVMSIPTLVVFKNGAEVQRIVGAQPKPRIEAAINSAIS